jgi:hypothetical protein
MKRCSDHSSALFTSALIEWGTPPDLYCALNKEFRFNLDPCAPGSLWDGREISWIGKRVFCNPPYGRGIDKWLIKGPEADVAVFLLPARTDTVWFHDFALKAHEIRFIKGRLHFSKNHIKPQDYSKRFSEGGAPFPSMLVIFNLSKTQNHATRSFKGSSRSVTGILWHGRLWIRSSGRSRSDGCRMNTARRRLSLSNMRRTSASRSWNASTREIKRLCYRCSAEAGKARSS